MPTTTCEISGATYRLDYTKMASKRGTYYFGKIHSEPVTGFAFTALTAGGNEFDDSREPLHRQEAIINAIQVHETSNV
ncbi:MAG: hypothetical protein E6H09_18885 [Bacteroidetes bacterium]|jgi:hypothetical protein|nr:MAG: hypothetical protein E6H09_18885 [Bacteroidota bacterium]